jgi:AraC-like DNA-binding protein
MVASGTAVFTDPADYRAVIDDATLDLFLTGPGDFKAHLTWLKLDNLHIFRGRETLPRIAYLSLAPARTFVSFPLFSSPQPVWNGVELQLGDIVLHSRGERGHQCTNGTSRWALLSLPPGRLTYYCKILAELDLADPPIGLILRPQSSAAVQLRRLHSKVCSLAEKKPEIFAYREAARAVEQEFIHALVNCLTTSAADSHPIIRRRHAEVMMRFEELLRRDDHKQPGVPELCAAIGVPERSLRECCAKFFGLSPVRYILLRRLNLVRAQLRRADPATTTVAQIALQYHFSEFGRFAAAYRTLFGERPSETLSKAYTNYAGSHNQ